jgi:hypothetical protein
MKSIVIGLVTIISLYVLFSCSNSENDVEIIVPEDTIEYKYKYTSTEDNKDGFYKTDTGYYRQCENSPEVTCYYDKNKKHFYSRYPDNDNPKEEWFLIEDSIWAYINNCKDTSIISIEPLKEKFYVGERFEAKIGIAGPTEGKELMIVPFLILVDKNSKQFKNDSEILYTSLPLEQEGEYLLIINAFVDTSNFYTEYLVKVLPKPES